MCRQYVLCSQMFSTCREVTLLRHEMLVFHDMNLLRNRNKFVLKFENLLFKIFQSNILLINQFSTNVPLMDKPGS